MPPEYKSDLKEEEIPRGLPNSVIDDDSIVISGMSGMFPMSNNLKGFSENLYNKVYMVTDKARYKYSHPELQNYNGIIPDLEPFDAQFFGIHAKLCKSTDVISRKILEQSYQAIFDAGLNIDQVRKTKLGVFVGSCFSETDKDGYYTVEELSGLGIQGCAKAMYANRISFWLDTKSPSMSFDAMCSSSIVALKHAVEAIKSGECDAAIVGGANICLHPQSSIHYERSMQMSPDGKVRSLSKDADGSVRSETINVLFLQKAKDAKRIYSEICHVECKFVADDTEMYTHLRSVPKLRKFYKEFYQQANVSPNEIEFIETFGTAIPEADKCELEAISEVFCKDRNKPLLVGSVMSNMGYTEAASGISSIIKVCLAYHTGQIAANLHCDNPRDDIEALCDGRMKVVNTHMPTRHSYCAVNNFSLGGLNGHVLLKGHRNKKESKSTGIYKTNMPYLVTISGRDEKAVKAVVDDLKSHPVDPEQIALLHNIHERVTSGHMARGYCIITPQENNETRLLTQKTYYYVGLKRPIWFVYSGIGSQWASMGAELMRIPIFSAAIERCRKVLEPRGLDIIDIITNPDKKIFDTVLNSFVGIAAVQIGLTDILTEIGIVPDRIIGHSVGELGCAYADGCFTAEEMILTAYIRGLVCLETSFIHGSMAAVGLGFKTISKCCPPEIEIACHNSSVSSTISGPSDAMKEFVEKLTAEGVFAKEVNCCNIPHHSKYIAVAGPELKKHLLKVIQYPKRRSAKWLSTSVPQDKWHLESAQFSSAEYHTNNVLNPVLFEETSRLIPKNALTIEIAPHGLLQAILKRSLPSSCINIALTRRLHSDPLTFLLASLGDLFIIGLNPKLQVLYPKIKFPVSVETGVLSHMVKWAHTESWPVSTYKAANSLVASQRTFVMSTYDDEQKYLEGHVIEGHVTYPLAALLVIVWETLAMTLQKDKEKLLVEFNDVDYYEDIVIHKDEVIRLTVTIQKGSGRFEVNRANSVLIEGTIKSTDAVVNLLKTASIKSTTKYELDSQDIYKQLFRKGYYYKDSFKSIKKSDLQFTSAEVAWTNDWVTFIDSLIQFNILNKKHDGVSKPRYIRSLIIDAVKQGEYAKNSKDLEASINELHNISECGGVFMQDIKFIYSPLSSSNNVLKRIEFMPFSSIANVDLDSILHAQIQLISENIAGDAINAINIIYEEEKLSIGDKVINISNELFDVNMNLQNVSERNLIDKSFDSLNLIIGTNFIETLLTNISLRNIIPNNAFILNVSKDTLKKDDVNKLPIAIILIGNTGEEHLTLMRWQPVLDNSNITCISVENDFKLLQYTRDNLKEEDRLIVTTKYPVATELKDLIKKWRRGSNNNKVHLYMSDNEMLSDEHFFEATRMGLTFNVSISGIWGSEFYLPLEKSSRSFTDLKLVNNGNNLNSLEWVDIVNAPNNDVHVKVYYAGINYYDAQKATGLIPCHKNEEITFGVDFSGLTQTGQRVMGIAKSGSLTTSVNTDPNLLWPVPEHWSLEDAATVPYPYLHAFYCLVTKGDIQPGHIVMIHGGAGALGQAVISIALSMGCEVFTTVNNVQKKKFLLRLYPELSEQHIGNSRDESFEEMVLESTNGKGCHIVINCLKGPLKHSTIKCVGSLGRFIDINPVTAKTSPLCMYSLTPQKSYLKTKFQHILEEANAAADLKKLHRMVTEGIIKGYVRPLTRVSYSPTETVRAFRLLKGSNHRGRVLLRMQELQSLPVAQSLSCLSENSYIILCGKQEFGLDVVDRLVLRNARKLIIHCDPSLNVGLTQRYIKSWQNIGVQVKINTTSLNLDDNHTALIKDSLQMGQVDGIFVIDQYDESILDAIEKTSRKLCPDLKYFALLKVGKEQFSVTETKILKDRNKINLPVLLLQLPALYTYDAVDTYQVPQTIHSALNAIETALGVKQHVPISTYSVGKTDVDVLEDISELLGINIPNTLKASTTLGELGVDDDGSEKVITYLEKTSNLSFNKEDVPGFTIATLLNVGQLYRTKQKVKNGKDLSIFFTKVDPEEIDATVDIILMSTIALNRPQGSDEFDCNETYMVIIPGMEGHYGMFKAMCERLKIPAVVLQPPLEHAFEPIPDIADRLIKILKKKININGKRFFICGYSFGALVGLEMAAMLESQGFEGTVFCLDSAPDVYKQQLANVIGDMSEEQLQNAVIEHMFTLMSNEGVENLKDDLQEASTWKDKMHICNRHLRGRVQHSMQYANLLMESAYGRICSSRSYIPTQTLSSRKLNSQVILLKGLVIKELEEIADDFGLSNYTKIAPVVYQLGSSHRYLPQDLSCSNIINRHLGEDILQEFAKRNLCDTYIACEKIMESYFKDKMLKLF